MNRFAAIGILMLLISTGSGELRLDRTSDEAANAAFQRMLDSLEGEDLRGSWRLTFDVKYEFYRISIGAPVRSSAKPDFSLASPCGCPIFRDRRM